MSEYVREVDEQDFDEAVLKSKTLVLVDVWAQWCGPCRSLAPIVETTAEHYASTLRIFNLNVDNSPAVAQRYGRSKCNSAVKQALSKTSLAEPDTRRRLNSLKCNRHGHV